MSARRIRRASPEPTLVVLGDLLLEVAVTAIRPVESGTDVPGTLRIRRGGSAANVALAFAGLGGHARFIGAVGRDDVGRRLVQTLRDGGVAAHVVRADRATARLLDLIDRGGERSFVTERSAADSLRATDLRPNWFSRASALHIPGYSLYNRPVSEAALAAVEMVREGAGSATDLAGRRRAGAPPIVSIDLSSRGPMLAFGRQAAWQLIAGLAPDVIFANLPEALALARAGGAPKLLELAPTVVIKEGSSGCRVLWRASDRTEQLVVATTPIAAADTTGAGDGFAAGFLHALLVGGGRSPEGAAAAWSAAALRRAALAGHRTAAEVLRKPRQELDL